MTPRQQLEGILDGLKLGIIGDHWFLDSCKADLGHKVTILDPDYPDEVKNCRAVLIHSCWPDPPSPWEGELLPEFGPKMRRLLSLMERYVTTAISPGERYESHIEKVPLIYWHLEGGNESCAKTFDHFKAASTAWASTSPVDGVPHVPMRASETFFGKPHIGFEESRGILFTGRWYADHPGRCAFLDEARERIEAAGLGDEFIIPEWGARAHWPERFHKYLMPKIEPFSALGEAYRKARVCLNHNLWQGGTSMRYPGLVLSGVPIVNPGNVDRLIDIYRDPIAWGIVRTWMDENLADGYDLTSGIIKLLKLGWRTS